MMLYILEIKNFQQILEESDNTMTKLDVMCNNHHEQDKKWNYLATTTQQ